MMFHQPKNHLLGAALSVLLTLGGGPALADVGVGPFTQAQVRAGHDTFMTYCAGCHGPRLGGGPGGRVLTRTHFVDSWSKETTKDLYRFISTFMPYNKPASLGEKTYDNLVAFILAANGAKPGPTPFSKDIAVRIGGITDGWTVEEVVQPLPSWASEFEEPCPPIAATCGQGR